MVSFKKLLLVTSLFLGEIAAIPTGAVERNAPGLEKRELTEGTNANNILESQFVTALTVKDNGGTAKVVDLTGCTAVFFYLGTTVRSVSHILCGNEGTDGATAATNAPGADSVTIATNTQTRYDNVVAGIRSVKGAGFQINQMQTYMVPQDTTQAATASGSNGSTVLTIGSGPKVSTERPS